MLDRFKSVFSNIFGSKRDSNKQKANQSSVKKKKDAFVEAIPSAEPARKNNTSGKPNALPKIKQLKANLKANKQSS
jgi:hypothetical protein